MRSITNAEVGSERTIGIYTFDAASSRTSAILPIPPFPEIKFREVRLGSEKSKRAKPPDFARPYKVSTVASGSV